MTPLSWLQALGVIGGIVVLIYGAGKAWGRLTGDLAEIKGAQAKAATVAEALGRKLDTDREKNAGQHVQIWRAHEQTTGRVETLERLAGLPAPWKRTQPIVPVDPEAGPPQDMFADMEADER